MYKWMLPTQTQLAALEKLYRNPRAHVRRETLQVLNNLELVDCSEGWTSPRLTNPGIVVLAMAECSGMLSPPPKVNE